MKIKLFKNIIITSILTTVIFSGCSENKTEAKLISEEKKVETTQKKEEVKPKTIFTKNNSIVNEVFKDTAKIAPDGKYMLIIFGTNTDPYTDKLKADIKNSKKLSKALKDDFSSYYLKAHENLRHKLYHEKELMDVDTKTMISIYGVTVTPTLIFADKNGKAIIIVPGYMPTKQFLTTIDFISSKKWENKDRKNGEVYEELRSYYIQKGIDVKKKEDK